MAEMKKMNPKELDKVVGGAMRTIENGGSVSYANIRKEPGLNSEVLYTMDNGAMVMTTGQTCIKDGITWHEVYLGGDVEYGWVAGGLLG